MSEIRQVEIFDTSLRDWFQWSRKIAKVDEKVEIAKAIDPFCDAIEVWFANASPDEFTAIQRISETAKARVYSLARANEKDIQAAYESVRSAEQYWIHTFIWTSPSHREKLWKTQAEIIESIKKHIDFSNNLLQWNWELMFSPEDAFRTEKDFLYQVFEVLKELWVDKVNIPDTVWFAQPPKITEVVSEAWIILWPDIWMSIHTHNDLWNAVANSIAAAMAWATMIQGTFPPLSGERVWNADLVQVITNIIKCWEYLQLWVNEKIILEDIYPLVSKISSITGERIPDKYPIVGRWVHQHGSWIHQDWVNKRSDTYEILSPEEIGLKREQSFFLTNLSWRAGLQNAISKYFLINLEGDELDSFYKEFMKLTQKQDYIEMDDIRILLDNNGYPLERNIHVDDYDIHLNHFKKVIWRAIFDWNSEDEFIWEWVWPVDAIFKIISEKYDPNSEIQLIDFTIDALWKQTEAKAKVYIKLQIGNKIYEEESISADIVKASAKAMINWMDRILRDKKIAEMK